MQNNDRQGPDPARQARSEAEQARAELQRFVYCVSHDLQRPIRHVRSFAEILEKRGGAELCERDRDLLERIAAAAVEAQEMVSGLLELSRVFTASTAASRCDCSEVLEQVRRDLGRSIVQTGAQVVCTGPLPDIWGYPDLLHLLFRELIENAIKFRRPDTAPCIRIAARRRRDAYVFSFADNGQGIPVARREDVFDVFRQLHARGVYPGMGLGLALCKRIVARHGGQLWVDATEGAGACFCFSIPVTSEAVGSAPLPPFP